MRLLLGIANVFLLLGMLVCCAAAMAGLVVFLPFVAGAWALNLAGLLSEEEAPRTKQSPAARAAEPNSVPVSGTDVVRHAA
jgi:uncharacterized SAM-binding protein YcdF (DUF218 family)